MIAWPPSWTARKQVGSKIDAAARALSRSASVPRLAAHQVSAGLLPAWRAEASAMTASMAGAMAATSVTAAKEKVAVRSEEHTSELQSLMRISYAVFCLQKKTKTQLLYYTNN